MLHFKVCFESVPLKSKKAYVLYNHISHTPYVLYRIYDSYLHLCMVLCKLFCIDACMSIHDLKFHIVVLCLTLLPYMFCICSYKPRTHPSVTFFRLGWWSETNDDREACHGSHASPSYRNWALDLCPFIYFGDSIFWNLFECLRIHVILVELLLSTHVMDVYNTLFFDEC